jgi:hypothetical protein
MVIRVNGVVIGAINEWNPRINRTITEVYEFGQVNVQFVTGNGEPFEKVPGNVSGMQVDVRRYDIYTEQMEQAFAVGVDLTMLSNQNVAFDVRETWTTPNNVNNYHNEYRGCWFSDIGRTISTTGDRIVNVNATLQYTRRERGAA